MVPLLLRALVLAAMLYALYLAFRPKWDFTVVVNSQRCRLRGAFPEAQREKLYAFLRDDVEFYGTVRISGRKTPSGYLALAFRGPLDERARQRIRNFLVHVL
ncbi:MAG TPA: hypothetical protein VMY37_12635 [Thermoguttaceae bacterium]|nr:hypothetical protein [Thermoguttaceae bacterium]